MIDFETKLYWEFHVWEGRYCSPLRVWCPYDEEGYHPFTELEAIHWASVMHMYVPKPRRGKDVESLHREEECSHQRGKIHLRH